MTQSRWKNINSFWGYLLIDELVRNDVKCFCISPGSRSTPLTIAAAENPDVESVICIDERSAGFYALGYARSHRKPAALICTSGTAAANYFPAVIEAKQSHLPLIILTADRPPELKDTGANQTIDQEKLYGDYPNWYFNLPCPEITISPEMVLTTMDQAVFRSMNSVAGPVHLNCQFREPLEPAEQTFPSSYYQVIDQWQSGRSPFTSYKRTLSIVDESEIKLLVNKFNAPVKGLLVVGQISDLQAKQKVNKLAQALKWPVFADILSGNRDCHEGAINYYDQLLSSSKVKDEIAVEIIIHIGRPLTSKRYLNFLKDKRLLDYIHVSDTEDRLDPGQLTRTRFYSDIDYFCGQIIERLTEKKSNQWYGFLKHYDNIIEDIISHQDAEVLPLSEISVARLISRGLKANHGLFLASSMPVRDFDQFAGAYPSNPNVCSNRGASGIDGTIASAMGFSKGIQSPVTVVLGDLALLHDLNSLSLVQDSQYPLIVVVINNGGGGIFSFLPVAKYEHVFEKYFAIACDFNFKPVAELFGLEYHNPVLNSDFQKIYKRCSSGDKSSLIEVRTDREKNYELHQSLQQQIIAALEK